TGRSGLAARRPVVRESVVREWIRVDAGQPSEGDDLRWERCVLYVRDGATRAQGRVRRQLHRPVAVHRSGDADLFPGVADVNGLLHIPHAIAIGRRREDGVGVTDEDLRSGFSRLLVLVDPDDAAE